MSDKSDQNDRRALAAEHALRMLTGEDARVAAGLEADDAGFAADVSRWRGRFAPLFGEVVDIQPPASLWHRVDQSTAPQGSNVIVLRRSVVRWRAAAAGMTALAASLGLILLQQPRPASTPAPISVPNAAQAPLVAMLGDDDKQMKVVASWDPSARRLVLAVPGDMKPDPAHSHELWIIPAGGKPKSLGTMPSGKRMHMQLAEALATLLQQGATIAISAEPPGGSPTGQPTGPVLLSGSLDRA